MEKEEDNCLWMSVVGERRKRIIDTKSIYL